MSEMAIYRQLSDCLISLRLGLTSCLPTIQPELMDACLDWMACISIDASSLLS